MEINNHKAKLNIHYKQGNILFRCTYHTITYNRYLFLGTGKTNCYLTEVLYCTANIHIFLNKGTFLSFLQSSFVLICLGNQQPQTHTSTISNIKDFLLLYYNNYYCYIYLFTLWFVKNMLFLMVLTVVPVFLNLSDVWSWRSGGTQFRFTSGPEPFPATVSRRSRKCHRLQCSMHSTWPVPLQGHLEDAAAQRLKGSCLLGWDPKVSLVIHQAEGFPNEDQKEEAVWHNRQTSSVDLTSTRRLLLIYIEMQVDLNWMYAQFNATAVLFFCFLPGKKTVFRVGPGRLLKALTVWSTDRRLPIDCRYSWRLFNETSCWKFDHRANLNSSFTPVASFFLINNTCQMRGGSFQPVLRRRTGIWLYCHYVVDSIVYSIVCFWRR